ncbi:MAG: cellulase family glycosylhydrolase [Candidatus Obscuribacter phosphatis]|uniref:Cellulase family glycosylhydrolase n=1 Tax=Candidatus Obscuribacter phosphatis TaxID=1906157 RepID=A0A8J7P6U5_9BACT|nr:cellulase family glycosylhydrolase [Candidatus Obscuribacter phosphatis]
MNQPCRDSSLPANDRVSETQSAHHGITSAAQEAYEPGTRNCSGRGSSTLPKEGSISFEDIFKAIDKDKNGSINMCEFRDFAASLLGAKPPVERPPVGGPVTPPGDKPPVERPPVGGPVTPPGDKPPVERPPVGGPVTPPGDKPPVERPPVDRPVTPPVENPPIDTKGNFSTRNGRIYDPSGREFQPRGFDIDNPEVALQDVDKIVGDWSVNMVRINATQRTKYGQENNYDKELMKKIVDEYTKRGVVVEINDGIGKYATWGSISTGNELKERVEFAKEIAEQFKDNPYVWFATPNESGGVVRANTPQDKAWLNAELAYNQAIRSTGNKNMIVQGDAFWGQGATAGGESAIVRHAAEFKKFGNVIAGQHVYNGSPNAENQLTSAVNKLRDAGFAVIVDEFGYVNQGDGSNPVKTQSGSDAVFKAVEKLGIGALPFRWATSGGDKVYNFTRDIRGKGPRTAWGEQIWRMTHAD